MAKLIYSFFVYHRTVTNQQETNREATKTKIKKFFYPKTSLTNERRIIVKKMFRMMKANLANFGVNFKQGKLETWKDKSNQKLIMTPSSDQVFRHKKFAPNYFGRYRFMPFAYGGYGILVPRVLRLYTMQISFPNSYYISPM